MKNIVSFVSGLVLLASPLVADSIWEGCGTDAQEAKLRLAQTIQTKVDSEFTSDKSSIDLYGLSNLFFSEVKHTMKQTSNVVLKDVNLEIKPAEYCESRTGKAEACYCAEVSKESLFSFTQALRQKVLAYNLETLPKYEKQKVIKLKEWLDEMRYARSLMSVYPERFSTAEFSAVEKAEKRLLDAREKYNSQFVKLAVMGTVEKAMIDGKRVKADEEVFLKPGEHHYEVTGQGTCTLKGSFTLEPETDRVITINLKEHRFPTLLINSNKASQVTLTIDGKPAALGTVHTIPRCSGELTYTLTYRDGSRTETEGDTITLEPALEESESYTFYSEKEMSKMKALAGSFSSGDRIEILYGYSYLPDDILGYDDSYTGIQMLQLNYMFNNKWLRHGPGVVYGSSSEADPSYELLYSLAMQLSSFGSNNRPLHIGTWVSIIPFIGIQAGLGTHEYYVESTGESLSNFRKDATEEEDDFVRDHVIARVYGGLDLAFNDFMSIQLYAKKSFTMEENTIVGAGLSLKLP